MATRIGVMRDGQILQVGAPRAIYGRPESMFVAGFVGLPGMNFLRGWIVRSGRAVAVALEVGDGGVTLPLDTYFWHDTPVEGRAVVLGLRAEDIGLPPAAGAFTAEATPIVVQPTGADTLVRLTFPGGEIVARAPRDHEPTLGRPTTIGLCLEHASVFCAVSQERL